MSFPTSDNQDKAIIKYFTRCDIDRRSEVCSLRKPPLHNFQTLFFSLFGKQGSIFIEWGSLLIELAFYLLYYY